MDSSTRLPKRVKFTPTPIKSEKPAQKPVLISASNSTFSYLDLIYYFLVVFSVPLAASYILRYFN